MTRSLGRSGLETHRPAEARPGLRRTAREPGWPRGREPAHPSLCLHDSRLIADFFVPGLHGNAEQQGSGWQGMAAAWGERMYPQTLPPCACPRSLPAAFFSTKRTHTTWVFFLSFV